MLDPVFRVLRVDAAGCHPELLAQVEAIFWQTSARTFPPGPERDAFRERWLGRYLQGGSDVVLLALAGTPRSPAISSARWRIPPSSPALPISATSAPTSPSLTPHFPAHLHINLATEFRSQGIGAALIEAFAGHARRAGAPGMHAVTGKGMRNVAFYTRCGFTERATALWNGHPIVFLGRQL